MVEEHCEQQPQEGLIEIFAEYCEGLFESLDIGVVLCPWEKKEAISSLLTEEGSGKEAVEEPQKHDLHPPFPDQVHILPQPSAHETHGTPTAKAIPSALPMKYFRKLVAFVQTFVTKSKTLAAAHVAWHNRWLIPKPSWFRFGAPKPQ